jgi:Tfp pilus assembly protein PilF
VFENGEGRSEVLHELATLYYKQRHFKNMRRVFAKYVASRTNVRTGKEMCSMMGLACTAMGDIAEGVKWYKKGLEQDINFKEAWINLFQAYKEGGLVRAPHFSTRMVDSCTQ